MWVKICGFTRREDAIAAAELGADGLGFVLAKKSRKYADPDKISKWINEIKGVEKIGVFYDESPGEIYEAGKLLHINTVQIHSAITAGHVALLKDFRIIAAITEEKALPLKRSEKSGIKTDVKESASVPLFKNGEILSDEVLLAATHNGAEINYYGRIIIDPSMGWGIKAVWRPYPFPFILAGGLTPDNVKDAIRTADPAGVDVSSGVEISPGIKDISLIERFILEAKS